eukprot:885605-Rhodomonas_salina.1
MAGAVSEKGSTYKSTKPAISPGHPIFPLVYSHTLGYTAMYTGRQRPRKRSAGDATGRYKWKFSYGTGMTCVSISLLAATPQADAHSVRTAEKRAEH